MIRRVALGVGALGCGAAAIGAAFSPRETAFSWLFAFTFWLSLSVGALIAVQTFHASRARWPVVCRRPLEVMSASAPLFALLFVPIAIAAHQLYPWLSPPASWGAHEHELLAHKAPYLSFGFFLARAAFFIVLWSVAGVLLYRWSVKQDALTSRDPRSAGFTSLQRKLSAGTLPLVVLSISFAALDWMMSLEPLWHSTVYGAYVGCGAVTAALSAHALWLGLARGPGQPAVLMRDEHFGRLGTLLLTFDCLWAYCGFSQYLLQWEATLPEEVTWYLARVHGGWQAAAWILIAGHFAVPFLALLQRRIKRTPLGLATVGGWLLLMHAVDLYWLILPAVAPGHWSFHWTAPLAWLGIGGLSVAAWSWLQGRVRAVPAGDPFLPHSLEVSRS